MLQPMSCKIISCKIPLKQLLLFSVILLLGTLFASATTLKGTIYNDQLEPEANVLVKINTVPEQRFLSKNGQYSFNVPPGNYTLTAFKGDILVDDSVTIVEQGEFVYDIFLIANLADEEDLLTDTLQQQVLQQQQQQQLQQVLEEPGFRWQYVAAGVILVFLLYRVWRARKTYGSLWKFRRRVKEESAKSLEQHKEELAKEPGYIENALEIIKKHDGRITQKELRKEMLYLSEAKVSLIITELEHKGKIAKVKKGRGNVIILK